MALECESMGLGLGGSFERGNVSELDGMPQNRAESDANMLYELITTR